MIINISNHDDGGDDDDDDDDQRNQLQLEWIGLSSSLKIHEGSHNLNYHIARDSLG